MSSELSPDLLAACQVLRQFNDVVADPNPAPPASVLPAFASPDSAPFNSAPPDYALLQEALRQVAQASDYQILGICADTLAQGQQVLAAYAQVLGYAPNLQIPETNVLEGAVYIKFNPLTGLCYANRYEGSYRGVLVSCQSADASDVNEMFGHLPLDLFGTN